MTKLTSKPRSRAAYHLEPTRPATTGQWDENEPRQMPTLPGEPGHDFDWTTWYKALADNPTWAAIQARYDQAADELHQAQAEFIRESAAGLFAWPESGSSVSHSGNVVTNTGDKA